jgi:membrane protein
LILLLLTLFGLFAPRTVELQRDLLSYFADFLPAPAFQLLRTTIDELDATASGGMLTFSVVSGLWFASGGVSSMISPLNMAYRIREARSWLKVRTVALALTMLISILLFTALFIVLMGGHFVEWLGTRLQLQPMGILLWKTIQWPAAILFIVVSYSLIYYCGPNLKERHWHWVTPDSAFAAILWLLASLGFRIYLHFFDTYSAVYGSLGAVMILLVWLYVTAFAFLIGGEINAEIERAGMRPASQ